MAQCASHLCRLKSPSAVAWSPDFPDLEEASTHLDKFLLEAVAGVYNSFPQPQALGALIKLGASVHTRGAFDQQSTFVFAFPHLVQASRALAQPGHHLDADEDPIESLLMILINNFDL
eukprot:TRINITY_DN3438_c0_g1_i12.p2 TRINITY_DN3438_c0_g1~~TRINITY_DN3438_c0_g1_i12.p2  ORF type:complete len:118 (-),score=24.37 TRINITY_DN3438_c0_g1_i12:53-406(-)